MIYTVGLIDKYEAALAKGDAVKDAGGWVWQTPEEARDYLVARNSIDVRRVYGVLADWERDTAPTYPRSLVRPAKLVALVHS